MAARIDRDGDGRMGYQLIDVQRCPHCSIAAPSISRVWVSHGRTKRRDGGTTSFWGAYQCESCGSVVSVRADQAGASYVVEQMFPDEKRAHEDVPEPARSFLQQAYETLHAPDAAAVMAGSAVDAMLKKHGFVDGSLYARIDEALAKNLLTDGMAKWAHSVRLGSNRPRHADEKRPHVSADEAKQSVGFAEALANFLFVLTARIDRGIKDAEAAQARA